MHTHAKPFMQIRRLEALLVVKFILFLIVITKFGNFLHAHEMGLCTCLYKYVCKIIIKRLLLLRFIMYFISATTNNTNDMRYVYMHAHVKWAREHVYANEFTPDMLSTSGPLDQSVMFMSGRCYSLTAGMQIVNCEVLR